MSHTGAGSRPRREELGRRGDTPRRGLPTEPGRAGLPAPSASASPPPSPAARAQRRPAGLPLSPRRILPAPSSPAAGGGGEVGPTGNNRRPRVRRPRPAPDPAPPRAAGAASASAWRNAPRPARRRAGGRALYGWRLYGHSATATPSGGAGEGRLNSKMAAGGVWNAGPCFLPSRKDVPGVAWLATYQQVCFPAR